MRELTVNELELTSGGNYSSWQTIGIATISGTLAMSLFRTTVSTQAALEAAVACGIPIAIAAVFVVGSIELLS